MRLELRDTSCERAVWLISEDFQHRVSAIAERPERSCDVVEAHGAGTHRIMAELIETAVGRIDQLDPAAQELQRFPWILASEEAIREVVPDPDPLPPVRIKK